MHNLCKNFSLYLPKFATKVWIVINAIVTFPLQDESSLNISSISWPVNEYRTYQLARHAGGRVVLYSDFKAVHSVQSRSVGQLDAYHVEGFYRDARFEHRPYDLVDSFEHALPNGFDWGEEWERGF